MNFLGTVIGLAFNIRTEFNLVDENVDRAREEKIR